MPYLQWDELDFLEYFEVAPEVDEEDGGYSYQFTRGALTLHLTVWGWRSTIAISLYREDAQKPLLRFFILVRGEVRRRREKWGEYLEFTDCACVPDQFNDIEVFRKRQVDTTMNLVLYVQPDIHIEFE